MSSQEDLAKKTLLFLTLVNLLNYMDRYVVSALVEPLRHALNLSNTQIGLLTSAFVYVYTLTSPIFGYLGDRKPRPLLIGIGVAIWSLATAMGGLASGFLTLVACRALVGVGEAAYGSIAPALLSDLFKPSERGRIYSFFFTAIPVGAALGFILGGVISTHFGWRAAFFVAGIPGLFLAYKVSRLTDPVRGAADFVSDKPVSYLALLKNTPFVFTVLGYAAYTFAVGGLAFWFPAFLERSRGLSTQFASTATGGVLVFAGFVGTYLGGYVSDKLLKRTARAYFWVNVGLTIIAIPFAWLALTAHDPHLYWAGIVGAELFLFASTGPVNSVLVGLVNPSIRAGAIAFSNFTIHVLGDGISPGMIGFAADKTSLEHAVLIVPFAIAVAAVLWGVSLFKA